MEKQIIEDVCLPISSDECGHSGDYPDSDEDIITDFHIANLDMFQRSVNLPTISITPHSPASKTYLVLEDNLQQLREIHENVQHMRHITIQDPQSGNLRNFIYAVNPVASTMTRVSTSCPSLNEMADFDALSASIGSSPLHQPSRKGNDIQDWLYQPEIQRRMTWSAMEDIPLNDKSTYYRQRSISLSSMESEADESSLIDNVDCGGMSNLLETSVKHRSSRSSGGATSTHSLNEADLQNDFNITKLKRHAEEGLVSQRLPLQKSISTPSILAVRELGTEPSLKSLMQPVITTSALEGHGEKRRKRGSIFFRKKKDKNKRNSHQWVSSCYTSSYICDVCNKQLSNKSALYCECCGITVHQNTCKDNILECVKLKGAKNNAKTSGFSNCKNHHTKRGSLYSEGMQNNLPHNHFIRYKKQFNILKTGLKTVRHLLVIQAPLY